METKENLQKELERLQGLKGSDNWDSSTRNYSLYELKTVEYKFGKRTVLVPKDNKDYVNLQSSRSINVELEDLDQDLINKASNDLALKESDTVRIEEIDHLIDKEKEVVELGFRVPKLLKYYKEKFGVVVRGYDIVPISIMVGQKFGYDVRQYDLSKCSEPLDIKNAGMIMCYHVLEHVSDPNIPIKKIYNEMSEGAYFHVEVPIEPGLPRIKFGHLFPFEANDLGNMLSDVGFSLEYFSTKTHYNGPLIERYLVKK